MELRAVVEMLNYLPPGMAVLVSSDSQYVRLRITSGSGMAGGMLRKGLLRTRPSGVSCTRISPIIGMLKFACVKAHSGILLNEGVAGDSYEGCCWRTPFPEDEPESQEEMEISEEEAQSSAC
jgi:hypothetical protein